MYRLLRLLGIASALAYGVACVVACAPLHPLQRDGEHADNWGHGQSDKGVERDGDGGGQSGAITKSTDATDATELHWSGRLQVDVMGPQRVHLSNDFELDANVNVNASASANGNANGNAKASEGELRLLGVLGTTLAVITWTSPEGPATIESTQLKPRVQAYDSLDALMTQWLGTPIPSQTIMAWLQGQAVQSAGWRFSHPSSEVFLAQRFEPEPRVDFKITRFPNGSAP